MRRAIAVLIALIGVSVAVAGLVFAVVGVFSMADSATTARGFEIGFGAFALGAATTVVALLVYRRDRRKLTS